MAHRLGRFLYWLIAVPLALATAIFAIANRGVVEVSLDPFPYLISVPLYVVALGALTIGVLLGLIVAWPALIRWRSAARHRARSVATLEDELARLNRDRAPGTAPSTAIVPGAGSGA